jgi:Mannosylglycerate hydrolase MGH1-like glycoside hydrolase domain
MSIFDTTEGARLALIQQKKGHWNLWGPFLSERAWGTVREDYSADGEAWSYLPHDHARSRAYRWNEDGLAGICDRHQYLCFALALWNGHDPFLKERLFGLAGPEGNHGEDVKEYYFYLDSTPTHSYMKYLYKYPQASYPYGQLLEENQRRTKLDDEYELVDTRIFDQGRYFDVIVEYAKADVEDLLIRVHVSNRGPEQAQIHLLPTLWFRNSWSWGHDNRRPSIASRTNGQQRQSQLSTLIAKHWHLGEYALYFSGADDLLFTENESNSERLFGVPSPTPYVKDAFHEYLVKNQWAAVNPAGVGTKAAARYTRTIKSGETITVDLRLASVRDGHFLAAPFSDFDSLLRLRHKEADEFYDVVLPKKLSTEAKLVARQAFAGMLWSKQYYHYVVTDWLEGDPGQPAPPLERWQGRNHDWKHLFTRDVISMPDKWEFPWFASWDLGFHCVALAYLDPHFAKEQILLMQREWYMHPNGQIPAYEWDFNSVNPPVLALAAKAVFEIERHRIGVADYAFLERVFQKMLLNFTWWVNRKDALGKNIFQGGFLGMDNIGAFDRDNLPPGYLLGQADGTSWMAAFAKSMLSTALQLAEKNPIYQDLASKFWEHYVYIANSMNNRQDPMHSLWDEQDGFFYDHLISRHDNPFPVRARTMVGFVPMFGASTVPADIFDRYPEFQRRREWFIQHRPDLMDSIEPMVMPGVNNTLILGLVRPDQLRSMLAYMLDENEFLSPFGVRSVSRYHKDHPLILNLSGKEYRLDYEPGESRTNLFGGNSNWRGPIWIPVNFLILMALKQYHLYYGDAFQVECPTGSGKMKTLDQVAEELARRLASIFLTDQQSNRPVFGSCSLFNSDPHWRDLIPFYEYFHGDTGRGCGASHQTGWTGLIVQILIGLAEGFLVDSLSQPKK